MAEDFVTAPDNRIKPIIEVEPPIGRETKASLIDFLTKNFAVVSAAVLGVGCAAAMTFTFSYLAVFDWTLIWLVEYPDIAKFILIAIGFISSFMITFPIFNVINIMFSVAMTGDKIGKYSLIVYIITIFIIMSVAIFGSAHSHTYKFGYIVYLSIAAIMFIFVITASLILYRAIVKNYAQIQIFELFSLLPVFVFIIAMTGLAAGNYTKYSYLHTLDLTTKSETITGVLTIMILSRYSIFYINQKIIVIQTADIVKITSNSSISN